MPTENKIAPNVQAALDYSRSFATAKPNIGLTEKEHIEGLANLLERTATENAALQQRLTTADQRIDELEAQLRELVSAVRSINRSPHYMVKVIDDDQPQYRQRKEWIDWVLELCDAALSASAEPGTFAGMKVVADPALAPDEIRIVHPKP